MQTLDGVLKEQLFIPFVNPFANNPLANVVTLWSFFNTNMKTAKQCKRVQTELGVLIGCSPERQPGGGIAYTTSTTHVFLYFQVCNVTHLWILSYARQQLSPEVCVL